MKGKFNGIMAGNSVTEGVALMKFIGLDIGTTTITGLIYDLEHKIVLQTISEEGSHNTYTGREDWERLQDPEVIMLQVERILQQLLREEPDPAGIGLTGQMHGIVYTDSSGHHVSPLYTWQDGRAGLPLDEAHSYAQQLSESTGYVISPGYGLATHFYNMRQGLVPTAAVYLCTIADYAALRLTGGRVPLIDPTQAAGIGGYSFEMGGFDQTAISRAGIHPEVLPAVVPSGTLLGHTLTGIPVYTSLGDNQASFLGSVPQPAESILLNIGTGSQLSVLLPDGTANMEGIEGMELRPYPGGDKLLVGAALSGGKSYALLERFFSQVIEMYTGEAPAETYTLMERFLRASSGDGQGLIVNTQFLGTRANQGIRGSIEGISLDNYSPGNLTHAFLQGMIDELNAFYIGLTKLTGTRYRAVIGSGNALRANPVLCSKVRSTFNLPFYLSAAPEEAAVGAALCAAVAAEQIGSFREAGRYLRINAAALPQEKISEQVKQRLKDK